MAIEGFTAMFGRREIMDDGYEVVCRTIEMSNTLCKAESDGVQQIILGKITIEMRLRLRTGKKPT